MPDLQNLHSSHQTTPLVERRPAALLRYWEIGTKNVGFWSAFFHSMRCFLNVSRGIRGPSAYGDDRGQRRHSMLSTSLDKCTVVTDCQQNIRIVSPIANCTEEPKHAFEQVPTKQMTRHLAGWYMIHGIGAMISSFSGVVTGACIGARTSMPSFPVRKGKTSELRIYLSSILLSMWICP